MNTLERLAAVERECHAVCFPIHSTMWAVDFTVRETVQIPVQRALTSLTVFRAGHPSEGGMWTPTQISLVGSVYFDLAGGGLQ